MNSSAGIRHRLMAVVLLGVLTSALSLVAVVRALSTMSAGSRLSRAREAVTDELSRLSEAAPSAAALAEAPGSSYVGLHGGWLMDASPSEISRVPLPSGWQAPLGQTMASAMTRRERVVTETPLADSTLVLAVEPSHRGTGYAWSGYFVLPSSFLRPWRWIAGGLAGATALLVLIAMGGALSFRRSTEALNATLSALASDLTTPVPPPGVAELTGIADGIRRMAAELLSSRERAERLGRELAQKERLAALGRVAAGIAHEVRNPLASIKLRLDVTAVAGGLSETAKHGIEAASQEIVRLDRLVSDLLLVAGKKMGPRRAVEIAMLVRSRAEALGPWAEAQGVPVPIAVDGQGAAAVDAESVARAIDNLLRNAVEASPAGARVTARIAEGPGVVTVTIEDRGRGIEAGRAAELFEPFFTTKAEGTGLGLAISRAIARAHGGDLTYAREGEVTRFSLSLPRVEAAEGSR